MTVQYVILNAFQDLTPYLCHPGLDPGSQGASTQDSGSKPGMTVQYVILNLIQDLRPYLCHPERVSGSPQKSTQDSGQAQNDNHERVKNAQTAYKSNAF